MSFNVISVIMPCRDGAAYLREAIGGIRSQRAETEIIVVDDGSTDGSGRIAAELGCRVIRKEKSEGQVRAKNDALEVATGQYVMFHDCDDVMLPGALDRLLAELEDDPAVMAVEAKVQDFISPEIPAAEAARIRGRAEPFWGLFTGAILMRRSVWRQLGRFDADVHTGEIIEWRNKMSDSGFEIRKLDFVSCRRRLHRSNFGRVRQKTEFVDYAAVLRARLVSRR